MLHHDHSITEGSDSVCTAGACETGLGLHIVTLSEDTCGVYVSVGVDLCAADKGDQTILVMEPLIGLKANETDVGPLNGTMGHETVIANRTRNLYRRTVHKSALYDGMAAGAYRTLCKRSANERKACANDNDLIFFNALCNGICLHFLFCILCIISHFSFSSPQLVSGRIAKVRLILKVHETGTADNIKKVVLILTAVYILLQVILKGLRDLCAVGSVLCSLGSSLSGSS